MPTEKHEPNSLYEWLRTRIQSPQTQRIALGSAFFAVLFGAVLLCATLIYAVFYLSYMPPIASQIAVHLDYSHRLPRAQTRISTSGLMKHSQVYTLALILQLPDSQANINHPNFMVDILITDTYNRTLAKSSRPAHVTYKSHLLCAIETLWNLPSILITGKSEHQTLAINLVNDFTMSSHAETATITLSTNLIETYSSDLQMICHFHGLTYFMYHWFFSTAILIISIIMLQISLALYYLWTIYEEYNIAQGSDASPPFTSYDTLEIDLPTEKKDSLTDLLTKNQVQNVAYSSLLSDGQPASYSDLLSKGTSVDYSTLLLNGQPKVSYTNLHPTGQPEASISYLKSSLLSIEQPDTSISYSNMFKEESNADSCLLSVVSRTNSAASSLKQRHGTSFSRPYPIPGSLDGCADDGDNLRISNDIDADSEVESVETHDKKKSDFDAAALRYPENMQESIDFIANDVVTPHGKAKDGELNLKEKK